MKKKEFHHIKNHTPSGRSVHMARNMGEQP